MAGYPYSPYQRPDPGERWRRLAATAVAVLAALAVLWTLFLSSVSPLRWQTGLQVVGGDAPAVSELVYPATLVQQVERPGGGEWLLPAAAAVLGEAVFVADTGNGRVLRLDPHGEVSAVLDGRTVEGSHLEHPMALAADGERLYVADSTASRVVVLDTAGAVLRVVELPAVLPGERPPRPIGLALRADGRLVVSDGENHRVLLLDAEGRLEGTVGTGKRASGTAGFNVPGALTLDAAGYIYVVDTLNGRVVKLTPEGRFAGQFGKLGTVVGTLSRPKGVAVDAAGRVFVSDALQAAVEVFGPDGTPLGFAGRREPGKAGSGSVFQAPGGLWLEDGRLYVMDRIAGLAVFALPVER